MNTTYFLNAVMGNLFGTKTDPSLPTTYYLGLSTTAPNKEGTGATEPSTSGTAYARVQLSNLSEPADGVITSEETITFPEATADWGTISHYVIYDAAASGNLLMYGPLDNSRRVEANTVVSFRPGGLTLTLADLEQS